MEISRYFLYWAQGIKKPPGAMTRGFSTELPINKGNYLEASSLAASALGALPATTRSD